MVGLLELSTLKGLWPLHCTAALCQLGTQAGVLYAQLIRPQLEEAERAAQVLPGSWAGFAGGQRLVRRHGVCPVTPEPAQLCLGLGEVPATLQPLVNPCLRAPLYASLSAPVCTLAAEPEPCCLSLAIAREPGV